MIHVKVGGGKEYFVKKTLIRGERFSRPSHLRAHLDFCKAINLMR